MSLRKLGALKKKDGAWSNQIHHLLIQILQTLVVFLPPLFCFFFGFVEVMLVAATLVAVRFDFRRG